MDRELLIRDLKTAYAMDCTTQGEALAKLAAADDIAAEATTLIERKSNS